MKVEPGKYKAPPGRGWLRKMTPKQMPYPSSPPYRGILHIPEACAKGRKLKLVAWLETNEFGTMIYIHVSTRQAIRRAFFRGLEEKRAEAKEYGKAVLQKARFEAGPKKRKYVPRPPPPPREVKRKDVIR